MSLTPDTARRLALIRILLDRSAEESRSAGPFMADSVNRLHDVAEMFLALAVQIHQRQIPREFLGYWAELEPALGRPLGFHAQMQKFNKVRVNLKHYGVEPAAAEIAAGRETVVGLLHDECEPLFGVSLSDVSVAELVECVEARELLDHAEARWTASAAAEAMADLTDAFDAVIDDYKQRKLVWAHRSVFQNTKDMMFLSPFHRGVGGKDGKFDEAVIESLEALDRAITLVGFGVDLRRWGKFTALTPAVRRYPGGRHVYARKGVPATTQEDFEFCRDFVITTALHLAEFDYDFDLWQSSRSAIPRPPEPEE